MRSDLSGAVALAGGLTAVVAALLSLSATPGMPMMPGSSAPLLPSALLLGFGLVVILNGLLLVLRVRLPMRPQGAVMVAYGALMGGVGTVMIATDLFAMMAMAWASASPMFLFGGVMVVLGLEMAFGSPTPGPVMATEASRGPRSPP